MVASREWYDELPSTQDRALALARAGAEEGTRVIARRQSRGRGRLDHLWASPEGGLYLSVIVGAPDERTSWLPLAVGASLTEALVRRYSLPIRLKWPNDLLVVEAHRPSRKLAGILVDRVASPRLGGAAVVGVGVNVATEISELPRELAEQVAVLATLVEPPAPRPEDLEATVVESVLDAARSVREPGQLEAVRARCRALLHGIGRPASIDGRPVGRLLGLEDDGALVVEGPGGRMGIRAGDLRVEEAP